MKRIIEYFKNILHKSIVKIKGLVKIRKNVKINNKTHFEGKNLLSNNVIFKDSNIGYASYIGNDSCIYNSSIGRYTCIGPYVKFVIGQHPLDFVSIHPCFYSTLKQSGFSYVNKDKFNEFRYADSNNKKAICVGNDVWICARATVLDGITIGDGAVVLAGAVVTKDVPPYAVVGGVPAKILKYSNIETYEDGTIK